MSSTIATPFDSSLIPAVSDRPGDDPIFSLNAEASRRAAAGESVLNATLGALMDEEGRLAVMPTVSRAISGVPAETAAAYAPISGPPAFLEAVVADTFGDSSLAEISVATATAGATGGLAHAIATFLDRGQALLTTDYYWSPYRIIASHAGREVELFEMFDDGGAFHLAAFERALDDQLERQGRALVLFNFPCHNPTGYSLDEAEWEGVAEIVTRAGARAPVTFLVDLAYARFGAPGSESWVRHVERMSESAQVLVAWSASKAYAQYGARVGALIAPNRDPDERTRIANALGFACRGTWSNCNHLGMLAMTELLIDAGLRASVEDERASLRGLLAERVRLFNAEASRAGLRYPRYEGGFFVTVFTEASQRAAERMRELGVFVVPIRGALRVAMCSTPAAQVPRLVAALAEGIGAGAAE
ncbi:MAG: aminotransferase class I/II-fold pyridoxal phosphate-dependent enzyme [Planctomycetota bacterium]|nr:aminotransferase class I/II-fold pyridoxal phosphate-dependent enzyme [Planctomycetota bacterium]MDP6761823.1 aminotransferase class I/II-fold pyridoxal phosphate-dependent enzyme [Planctomycetota bacterium]MDP6988869.1 aminotransferase class I/II-fold pyridoxal phosphate-dependent enzyme [Planctomycetota bacterium]